MNTLKYSIVLGYLLVPIIKAHVIAFLSSYNIILVTIIPLIKFE